MSNMSLRRLTDKGFTGLSIFSVSLIAAALVVILAPMVWRGTSAVVFYGTIEFRKRQFEQYGRGDQQAIEAEVVAAEAARRPVYERLDAFARGLDVEGLEKEVSHATAELDKQLRNRHLPVPERLEITRFARRLRDRLVEAFRATDKEVAEAHLAAVLAEADETRLRGTVGMELFELARQYRQTLEEVDLAHRAEYAAALAEVQTAVRELFGPRLGAPRPPLEMNQYGRTRMDMARRVLDNLYYAEVWVSAEGSDVLVKKRIPREAQFVGTRLAPLFPYVREHVDAMLRPKLTLYLRYFVDDSIPGHFFGGVGPEIVGTLVITVLAVLFAFPVGVISAAYLVEVAGENRVVRGIRMCINTLAGVPSIVFGLFGLAFFVAILNGQRCVLAASLTMAVLILPVIIRASEEAIRSVPLTYKEAALALGASRLRCFLTVQLPAALPGVLTGVILSMSRAAGETAPILFTGAVAVSTGALDLGGWPPFDWLFSQTRALSYGAYDLAVSDRIAAMVPHQQWGMVTTLVALVLVLNVTAIALRWRVSRKLRGS